jgi:amino acid adenylation domain-containing protein
LSDVVITSSRVFRVDDASADANAPSWLGDSLAPFRKALSDPEYPCHFGRQALRSSDLCGTYVGSGDAGLADLRSDLAAFLDASRQWPRRRMVLAVFCTPEEQPRDHAWYGERFWSILRYLHEHDDRAWSDDTPVHTDDAQWEFSFHGTPMFVFAASPTHVARRSRNLGPGLVLLFQPRNVFAHIEGGTPAGTKARRQIRARQDAWDLVPVHPFMGDYGDPANYEWKQYYIADDPSAMYTGCPVSTESAFQFRPRLLHELIERQADLTPDAVAVVSGEISLDYRTLESRANHLAHRLISEGVGPEDRVGVLADRSVDTVVALIGVLKAGGAYVPIDPAYPDERRAFMLDNADVEVVVAPGRLFGAVPLGPRKVLASDSVPAADTISRPRSRALPENVAYVIYTSGSTGAPKGVLVTHRQILHATRANLELERPEPEAFLVPISFSFDANAIGTYWTLASGGCLVIPADGEHNDPARLRELIRTYGVTHTDSTPALFDLILGDDPEPVRSLRCVIVGGETCPPELVRRIRAALPGCVVENNYGPTEAAVWTTAHVMTPGMPDPHGPVPIGVPIPRARVHIVNDHLAPLSAGHPGELVIGGAGVARGYQSTPSLTAERFVPDPFAELPGQRIYRTGDVAVQGADGSFTFVGRRDGQVKVRGYRVELGEIEAALRRHPDIAEAVIVLRLVADEQVLVGYVRPFSGRSVSTAALRSFLAPRLPGHLVPPYLIAVTSLPRTVSGKVDRQALPSPGEYQEEPLPAIRPLTRARRTPAEAPR